MESRILEKRRLKSKCTKLICQGVFILTFENLLLETTTRVQEDLLPRSPNMEQGLNSIENYFPMVEVQGIKRRMTMKDPIDDLIPLGKTLFPFFYILGFLIFLFMCLILISLYQIKWTYHINDFIYEYMIESDIEVLHKDFIGNAILDIVSPLITQENLLNFNKLNGLEITHALDEFINLFTIQIFIVFIAIIYLRHYLEKYWAKQSKDYI